MESSQDGRAEPESGLRRGQYSLRDLFELTTLVAVVCGLVEWHGFGVLVVIVWNAAATVIALGLRRAKRKAAAASLLCVFVGWSVAFVVLWVEKRDDHSIGDLLGTAALCFLGWVLLALPVIMSARPDGLLYRVWFASLAGIGLVLLPCAIVLCAAVATCGVGGSVEWRGLFSFLLFAAVIGVITGALFPWLVRSRCPTYLLFSGPSILFLSFWCLLWPALEYLTPDFTYAYGTPKSRARSLYRVFQYMGPGSSMTIADFQRRFPRASWLFFPASNGESILRWPTERYDYRFRVRVDKATGCIKIISSELREHQSGVPPSVDKSRFIY